MERVTKELGNIAAVLSYSLHDSNPDVDELDTILRLCLFEAHVHYGDCKPLVLLAIDAVKRQQPTDVHAIVTLTIALVCSDMAQGQRTEAMMLVDQIETMHVPAPLQPRQRLLHAVLFLTHHRFDIAAEFLLQVVQMGDSQTSLHAAIGAELLAGIRLKQGNMDEARSRCAEAGQVYASTGNGTTETSFRLQELTAMIFIERRNFVDAFQILQNLLYLYKTSDYQCGRSRIQRMLYQIHYLDGRYEPALTGYAGAKRAAEQAHDMFAVADCERGSARTYESMQQPAAAFELYKLAIALFQQLDEPVEVAYTRLDLGRCMCDAQLPADGLSQMSAAMAAFDFYGLQYPSAKCKQYVGKVLASLKAVNEGISRLRAALETFKELDRKVDAADCYAIIGGVCFPARLDEAEEATKSAMALYEEAGKPESKANCTVILASCYRKRGRMGDVTRVAQEGLGILAGLEDRSTADEGVVQMLKSFLGHPEE